MQRRSILVGAAALGLLPTISAARAQTAAATAVDQAKLPALMGGDFATATSQLALEQSSSDVVKTFAQLEIAEQAAVAAAFGSAPGAAGLSKEHAAALAQLQALEGAQFDAMYVDGQIEGHEELLEIHQRYARNGDDPMARGAAMVGVPAIQTHLAMLRGIRQSLS